MSPARHATVPAFLHDFDNDPYSHVVGDVCLTRDVFRRDNAGPPVVLMHEIPAISHTTVDIAGALFDRGFSVVLPSLWGRPTEHLAGSEALTGVTTMCMSSLFGALSHDRTPPIASWVRGLAQREARRSGGRSVGVVGMCFSGGFALAAVLEEGVDAAVMSQPALPFLWGRDLGLSAEDLAILKRRIGRGSCIRILRYSRDWKSPAARLDRICAEFPDSERVVIPTDRRSDHSVLRDGLTATPGTELDKALRETWSFLEDRLDWHPDRGTGRRRGTTT